MQMVGGQRIGLYDNALPFADITFPPIDGAKLSLRIDAHRQQVSPFQVSPHEKCPLELGPEQLAIVQIRMTQVGATRHRPPPSLSPDKSPEFRL